MSSASTLPVAHRNTPSRPARIAVPLVAALLISGCVVASTALWRSNIAEPVAARSVASAMASDGALYQGYQANDAIWLRKLDSTGATLWQQAVAAGNLLALVPADDGAVIMVTSNREVLLINNDGTTAWTQEAAPAGTRISSWSRYANDRFYLGYTAATSAGLVALDADGALVWSHVLDDGSDDGLVFTPQALAVFSSGEVLAKLLVEATEVPMTREGQLYAFDSDGVLVTAQDADINTRLLDNQHSAYLLTGADVQRVDETGNPLWNHSFAEANPDVTYARCAGDQNLEVACSYTVYEANVRFDNVVAWLNADGDVRAEHSSRVVTTGYQYASQLYFAGNGTWIQQRDANQNLAAIPLLFESPEERWQTLQVLQDDGTLQQTLIMRSTITSRYLCSDILHGCERTNRTGDSISNVLADNTQLYVIGNRANQGFISSYALD